MEEDNSSPTIFNSALACLERLHECLLACRKARNYVKQDSVCYPSELINWKTNLENVYVELDCKLLSKEKKVLNNCFMRFNKFLPLTHSFKDEFGNVHQGINIRKFQHYYKLCDLIEKRLRKLADKNGMLIPRQEGKSLAIMH